MNGIVLWEGQSKLGGGRIAVIATGLKRKSDNRKTGGVIQVYILCADISPQEAIYAGKDSAVCGGCPHRAVYGEDGAYERAGSCYVNIGQGPTVVWRTYKRGAYPQYDSALHDDMLAGRVIRFGSYGDPAAAPVSVWRSLAKLARKRMGYTHQWRRRSAAGLKRLVMASVDTSDEQETAVKAGWRTFRVKTREANKVPGEVVCPAAIEAGQIKTCDTCGACSGAKSGLAPSIVINAHGFDWKIKRFEETTRRLTSLATV